MNRLTHHIAREIRYPLITPVVVCLSPWRHYYLTYPHLNLNGMKLSSNRSLHQLTAQFVSVA
jgi:hypothetical protein